MATFRSIVQQPPFRRDAAKERCWRQPPFAPQEKAMSEPIRSYEPLTSENAALVLVDHQVGLMTGVRDYSTGELKHNVVALAKAAKALKLPIVVTTTARESMWGPTFPELVEALPGIEIIDRSSVNAFDAPGGASRHRGARPQEADLRRHLARSLRSFSGNDGRR